MAALTPSAQSVCRVRAHALSEQGRLAAAAVWLLQYNVSRTPVVLLTVQDTTGLGNLANRALEKWLSGDPSQLYSLTQVASPAPLCPRLACAGTCLSLLSYCDCSIVVCGSSLTHSALCGHAAGVAEGAVS